MVFSRESGLFVSSPRSEKHTLHAILNAFAFVSILFGIGAVYLVLFHIDHINTYRDAYMIHTCRNYGKRYNVLPYVLQCDSSARRRVWVDLDICCSTVRPGLLGMMGIWQKRLCSWARWGNTKIKVNPKIIA